MQQDGSPARAGICDFGLQFIFRMPAVPRGYRAGAERGWSGRAAKWTSCARSSIIQRFIEATVERVRDALQAVPADARENVQMVYIAHSIPTSMANTCDYVKQLEEVRRLVSAARHGGEVSRRCLVYQSRSGAPGQPWLEPDILDYLRRGESAESGDGGGAGADQFHLRSHGSFVRPGHRGAATLRFAESADDAGENGRRASRNSSG